MTIDQKAWHGIYPACLTPLTPDESLDAATVETLIGELMAQGVSGLYVTGSTGEEYALDDRVRCDAFNVAARTAAERVKVIAHVGGVPTRRAIAMAKAAADQWRCSRRRR